MNEPRDFALLDSAPTHVERHSGTPKGEVLTDIIGECLFEINDEVKHQTVPLRVTP